MITKYWSDTLPYLEALIVMLNLMSFLFQRFVSDPEIRRVRHSTIAEYFVGRWAGQSIPYVGKDGKSLDTI